MKIKRTPAKNNLTGSSAILPLTSERSLAEFRRAATAFTEDATSSRRQALKVLRREGILNAKGKLTKNYS